MAGYFEIVHRSLGVRHETLRKKLVYERTIRVLNAKLYIIPIFLVLVRDRVYKNTS